jgi:hypothetical protein
LQIPQGIKFAQILANDGSARDSPISKHPFAHVASPFNIAHSLTDDRNYVSEMVNAWLAFAVIASFAALRYLWSAIHHEQVVWNYQVDVSGENTLTYHFTFQVEIGSGQHAMNRRSLGRPVIGIYNVVCDLSKVWLGSIQGLFTPRLIDPLKAWETVCGW